MKVERKFEEEWRNVFDGAEVTPSDAVWTGIDLELANAESSSMKKRIVFYQRLAAASVLFALLVGGVGFYRWKETERLAGEKNGAIIAAPDGTQVAQEKNLIVEPDKKKADQNDAASLTSGAKNRNTTAKETEKEVASNAPPKAKQNTDRSLGNGETKSESVVVSPTPVATANPLQSKQTFVAENKSDNQRLLNESQVIYQPVELAAIPEAGLLPIIDVEGEPVKEELVRKLPAISAAFMIEPRKAKVNHERIWASVTAAAGNYSTMTGSAPAYGNTMYNSVQSNMAGGKGSGSSYTYGMLAGLRVAKRIVVQSGVQYSNQTIGTTSNINAPSSLDAVANFSKNTSSPVSYSAPYSVTNANEFISVPVQAGYLFIDRKVGLQLNSGVSTDFFVRNTLSDPSGQRQSYSQGAGQDSPYRAVNFSGLMSSEVSYKLGRHYRLSVVPGVRYSFAPMLKSSVGTVTGNNMVWDIGFRFRYIFK